MCIALACQNGTVCDCQSVRCSKTRIRDRVAQNHFGYGKKALYWESPASVLPADTQIRRFLQRKLRTSVSVLREAAKSNVLLGCSVGILADVSATQAIENIKCTNATAIVRGHFPVATSVVESATNVLISAGRAKSRVTRRCPAVVTCSSWSVISILVGHCARINAPRSLPCGHLCQELCHEPCTLRCPVKVPKSLPCGHTVQDFCSRDPDKVICSEPCKCLLDCEHECAGSCGTCQQGRLHVRCKNKCDRQLVCGHICKFPCTPNCPPCMDECTNYCKHSKCPLRCYQPCAPCMEPCPWQCQHIRCTARCGEPCDRPPCNAACTKWLSCGHRCIGLCGEKCPHLCLECNRNEVLEVFFGTEEEDSQYIELEDCGHVFEVEGLDRWIETETEEENKVVQTESLPQVQNSHS